MLLGHGFCASGLFCKGRGGIVIGIKESENAVPFHSVPTSHISPQPPFFLPLFILRQVVSVDIPELLASAQLVPGADAEELPASTGVAGVLQATARLQRLVALTEQLLACFLGQLRLAARAPAGAGMDHLERSLQPVLLQVDELAAGTGLPLDGARLQDLALLARRVREAASAAAA